MPSRLTDLLINRVAFVGAGDNPKADVLLWKAKKANPDSTETHVPSTSTRKKAYSTEQRIAMAKKGQAIPVRDAKGEITDGRYPIADAADLSNAISAYGRGAGDKGEIKAYIVKRAKALGKSDQIPEAWSTQKARSFTPGRIARLREAHGALGDLIEEAGGREEDHVNEPEFTLPDDTPDEVVKHVEELRAAREKAEEERDEAKAAKVSKDADEPEPNAIEKALANEDLDDVTKEALRTLKEQADRAEKEQKATAETLAKKMEDERNAEAVAKVRELRYLALKPEDVGPRLAKLRESDSELADAVEAAMGTVNGIASEAFVAIGRSGDDVAKDGNGPLAQLKAKAKEIAKAEHISEDAAFTKAIATPEGKELHAEYKRQQEEVDAR